MGTGTLWQWVLVMVLVLASAGYAIAHLMPGAWRRWRRALAVRVLAGHDHGWRRRVAERLMPAVGTGAACNGCEQCEPPSQPADRAPADRAPADRAQHKR